MDYSNKIVLEYYAKLTSHYDNGNFHPPEVILPPVPEVLAECIALPLPTQYLLPSVILWDPLEQLECFENGLRCPFDGHSSDETCFLEPKRSRSGDYCWQAGTRTSLMPRLLASSSWPTVLLSRLYYCKSKIKHKVYIAHDPEILSKIPLSESHKIPFVLLHRTGFTKELCETVISLTASGMSLENIEQVICQQHMTNFTQCKAKFEEDKVFCLRNAGLEEEENPVVFPDYKLVGLPSMEMILGSLLDNYQEYRAYYYHSMSELSAEVLLMGFFFQSCQQIGTLGDDGKTWVPMYKYVFAVMNEKGQVIAWQITKDTNIEDVSYLLQNVHCRLKKQGVDVQLILTPECCQQKQFISSIFGETIQVKMDPKFAYRRLEKRFKVRKGDHDHVATCLQDFALVFNKSTDLGADRKEETPTSETILGNLSSFISQWKLTRGETNERLLHDPALRELDDIMKCVNRECVSNVPPNSGANFINDLRSFLKPVLHKRFISADLAIPALTVLFYCWNEIHSDKEAFVQIRSYKDALDAATIVPTTEVFGCVDSDVKNESNKLCSSFLQDPQLLQLFCLLWEIDEDSFMNDSHSLLTSNTQTLNSMILSKVLLQIENSNHVFQTLKSIYPGKAVPIDIWHFSVLPCCTQIFSKSNCPINEESSSSNLLQDNLEMFGGKIVNQEDQSSDGFFTAVTHSLQLVLNSLESENPTELAQVKEHLNTIGVTVDELKIDTTILRQLVSHEFLQNKDIYCKLVTSPLLDFNQEAELFVHKGYFQAEMSNLLPIAVVRLLRMSLVIFTSLEHFPVVPIVSAEQPLTSRSLYIAYSATGSGNYYPIDITTSSPPTEELQKPKYACRCGLGNSKNKERQFCVHISGQYLTRCECFRSGQSCSHLCRCFNCSNPNGTSTESRALHATQQQKTRLRTKHKLQKMKRKLVHAKCETSWSDKECLALAFLVHAFQFTHNLISVSHIVPEKIAEEYSNLQQLSEKKMVLKTKSLEDIKKHLDIVSICLEKFKALCRSQMDKHWSHVVPVQLDMSDNNQLVVIVESSDQANI